MASNLNLEALEEPCNNHNKEEDYLEIPLIMDYKGNNLVDFLVALLHPQEVDCLEDSNKHLKRNLVVSLDSLLRIIMQMEDYLV